MPTDLARRAAETYVAAVRAAGLTDDEALVLVHGALLGRQSVTPTSTGSGSSLTPKDVRTPSRT